MLAFTGTRDYRVLVFLDGSRSDRDDAASTTNDGNWTNCAGRQIHVLEQNLSLLKVHVYMKSLFSKRASGIFKNLME